MKILTAESNSKKKPFIDCPDSRHALSRIISLFSLLFIVFPVQAAWGASGHDSTPSSSQSFFEASLQRFHRSAGHVGVKVAALPSGEVVWEYGGSDVLVPASLMKILTAYAALKTLGHQHSFETALWGRYTIQNGHLEGPLWIRGEGDPQFLVEGLQSLARQCRETGVKSVGGGILVDNTAFSPTHEEICLDREDFGQGECPVVSATALQFNTVTVAVAPEDKVGVPPRVSTSPAGEAVIIKNLARTASRKTKKTLAVRPAGQAPDGRPVFEVTGRVPLGGAENTDHRFHVRQPAAFVAWSLREALSREGIAVRGRENGSGAVPPGAAKLASCTSPPLNELLKGLNRYSNNFMAEMLLRAMAGRIMGLPGSAEKGLVVIDNNLTQLGVPPATCGINLHSGSGLSRVCRVSPDAFIKVLTAVYADPALAPDFLASLAVNGGEGTLRNRLKRAPVVVRGKTGTLANVVSFAGYVTDESGTTWAATVILNDVTNLWAAREAVDTFLEGIPNFLSGPAVGRLQGQS